MKKLMFTLLVSIALCGAANVTAQTSRAKAEVERATHAYDAAILKGDKAAFEALFADEYIATNEEGRVRNKQQDIAHMTSPDLKFTSAESFDADRRITMYGNVAVETGRYAVKGTWKGSPFTEEGRYTTTWVKRNGRWQIVADHSSLVSKDSASANQ